MLLKDLNDLKDLKDESGRRKREATPGRKTAPFPDHGAMAEFPLRPPDADWFHHWFDSFTSEHCETLPDGYIFCGDLYRCFSEWLDRHSDEVSPTLSLPSVRLLDQHLAQDGRLSTCRDPVGVGIRGLVWKPGFLEEYLVKGLSRMDEESVIAVQRQRLKFLKKREDNQRRYRNRCDELQQQLARVHSEQKQVAEALGEPEQLVTLQQAGVIKLAYRPDNSLDLTESTRLTRESLQQHRAADQRDREMGKQPKIRLRITRPTPTVPTGGTGLSPASAVPAKSDSRPWFTPPPEPYQLVDRPEWEARKIAHWKWQRQIVETLDKESVSRKSGAAKRRTVLLRNLIRGVREFYTRIPPYPVALDHLFRLLAAGDDKWRSRFPTAEEFVGSGSRHSSGSEGTTESGGGRCSNTAILEPMSTLNPVRRASTSRKRYCRRSRTWTTCTGSNCTTGSRIVSIQRSRPALIGCVVGTGKSIGFRHQSSICDSLSTDWTGTAMTTATAGKELKELNGRNEVWAGAVATTMTAGTGRNEVGTGVVATTAMEWVARLTGSRSGRGPGRRGGSA